MEDTNLMIVGFFALATVLIAFIGSKMWALKKQPMQSFGLGLYCIALAFLIWTGIVLLHPSDMKLATTLGLVPFFASFLLFIHSAASNVKPSARAFLYFISGSVVALFVVLRFFVFSSDPGFTESGFFAFNVDPIVLYFYSLITAFSFVPAIYVVGRHIKPDMMRVYFELGLTLTSLGMVVMVMGKDEGLQIVNGIGMIAGLVSAAIALGMNPVNKKTIK